MEHTIPKIPKVVIYNCDICKDQLFVETDNEHWHITKFDIAQQKDVNMVKCQCLLDKEFTALMNASGIYKKAHDYTMNRFETRFDWQKELKDKALEFIKEPTECFLLLGQSGIGKSHLCTALMRGMAMVNGLKPQYLIWERLVSKMKDDYNKISKEELDQLYRVEVLYLDDFLKTVDNNIKSINMNAVSYARDIINQRYNRGNITIISSEWSLSELRSVDHSMAGRLMEMATPKYIVDMTGKEERDIRFKMAMGEW